MFRPSQSSAVLPMQQPRAQVGVQRSRVQTLEKEAADRRAEDAPARKKTLELERQTKQLTQDWGAAADA